MMEGPKETVAGEIPPAQPASDLISGEPEPERPRLLDASGERPTVDSSKTDISVWFKNSPVQIDATTRKTVEQVTREYLASGHFFLVKPDSHRKGVMSFTMAEILFVSIREHMDTNIVRAPADFKVTG